MCTHPVGTAVNKPVGRMFRYSCSLHWNTGDFMEISINYYRSPQFSLIVVFLSVILIRFAELFQIFIPSIPWNRENYWKRNKFRIFHLFLYFWPLQTAALPLSLNSRVSKFIGLPGGGYQDIR